MFALQRDRWILWLPVAMISGAALWLAAPTEPPWWLGPVATGLGAICAVALTIWPTERHDGWPVVLRRVAAAMAAVIAAAGLGLLAGTLRGISVEAAPYEGSAEPVQVEGWVVANDASDNGPRLRLLVRGIEGVETPPRYVRVSVSEAGLLTAGRAARCTRRAWPAVWTDGAWRL
jgi:competence protein ComEC